MYAILFTPKMVIAPQGRRLDPLELSCAIKNALVYTLQKSKIHISAF